MNLKSNRVITTFVLCFYLFALGSFGIRARWIFTITIILTTFTAMINDELRVISIRKFKKYWYVLYTVITVLVLLPNARHETDIYNYLTFVTITTYVVTIAKTNDDEIKSIINITIKMGLFFAVYMSFFRVFPNIYDVTIYRLLASSVKETYKFGTRFGYGLAIGNGYTFSDSAIWLGITSLISKDISEGEKEAKNKIYLMIMLVGMLLEGRKSELLAALITIIFLYYYGASRDIKKLGKKITYVLIAAIIAGFGIKLFGDSGLFQRFTVLFERLAQVRAGTFVDFSSGRFGLWINAINLFKQYPIMGAGWGRFANYTEGYFQAVTSEGLRNTHNVLLQLLCETGVVGTILVVVPIIFVCNTIFNNTKVYRRKLSSSNIFRNHLFSLGIVVYSLILSFLDPNFYGQYFWCLFAIAFVIEDYTTSF